MGFSKTIDIKVLFDHGYISELDYYFAKILCESLEETDKIIFLSCALVSRAVNQGHVFINIDQEAGKKIVLNEKSKNEFIFYLPQKDQWIRAISNSIIIGEDIELPLVFDQDNNLYLARYFDYQNKIVGQILKKCNQQTSFFEKDFLEKKLNEVFPNSTNHPHLAAQQNAIKKCFLNQFVIISGGPGTGKTFLVNVLIDLLNELADFLGKPYFNILCLAPTGKAASKLFFGKTIHRALKPRQEEQTFFHNKENPITADVVIVDEASMIDISLMAKLLEAVPENAKLILLGDKNQLSSVEAGAVFGDICSSKKLTDFIVFLDYNFRSNRKKGLDQLSKAVRTSDINLVKTLLYEKTTDDVTFIEISNTKDLKKSIEGIIKQGYLNFFNENDPLKAIGYLNDFRILSPFNNGDFGTDSLNKLCKNILRSLPISDIENKLLKRTVMIKKNDYQKGLFNGDTGVIFEENGLEKAIFIRNDGIKKEYRAKDLPIYEDAFAVTIHKSQGSEFEQVLIILPLESSSFITKQLLYTGLTRAKERVTIVGTINVIQEAVNLIIQRNSNISRLIDRRLN